MGKKVASGKVDRSMKIFNPAYFLKSELIPRQHQNSLIHPIHLILEECCKHKENYMFSHHFIKKKNLTLKILCICESV